ncbi:organic cation/carnitine transporter 4-like [Solanum pennellii]|uniref:Organic cation/carnitine transporter 4-like n=1 Tax=Solanum pennellii TaxID=28526 RepID=A0ABM1H7Y9_SOLPN|nr:organic cation/carnitine transporter 4-like [Solanum pennellii]
MSSALSSNHNLHDDGDLRSPLASSQEEANSKKITMDEMLEKYCGEFGLWQVRHLVLTCLAWLLEGILTMVMIFADREPAWHYVTSHAGATSRCSSEPGSWQWTGGKGSSTMSEFGLICGEKYKVGLVQSIFFAGCMIGAGVFGHLSDTKLGRKGSLTIVCILNAIFSILTAFSSDYSTYVLFRFLSGFSNGGTGLCAFVLATEPVGQSWRGVAGMSTLYLYSTGIVVVSVIAYFIQPWRSLYIASSIPSLIFVIFVLPFLHESPRWYLVRGKVDEAMKIMQKIAVSNGKQSIPNDVVLALDSAVVSKDDTPNNCRFNTKKGINRSILDVLRSPVTRIRLLVAVATNFFCSIVYYGLSLNAVNLGTNLYLNVALNSVSEMPAYLLSSLVLDRIGRKPLAIGTMWFSAIFCLVGSILKIIDETWKFIPMVCGLLGIFGISGTFNLLLVYGMELFPTVVRNAALGCSKQAINFGAILAPIIVVLGDGVPFAVFGICGIIGGFLVMYLPETLTKPLYDTIDGLQEGEAN